MAFRERLVRRDPDRVGVQPDTPAGSGDFADEGEGTHRLSADVAGAKTGTACAHAGGPSRRFESSRHDVRCCSHATIRCSASSTFASRNLDELSFVLT
jgi:hypothetical protein